MAGTELELPDEQGIAARLSSRLQAQWLNQSLMGCGNDRIYDTTVRWLENNTADLVVIGWSEFVRIQWYLDGRMWEINELGVGEPVPAAYQKRYEQWCHDSRNNGWYDMQARVYWHNKIYNLHKMLEHKNIAHLFFNAFTHFKFPVADETEYHLDWNRRYFEPYTADMTYVQHCLKQNYQQVTPGYYHFEARGQDHWAQILYDYIQQNNIL